MKELKDFKALFNKVITGSRYDPVKTNAFHLKATAERVTAYSMPAICLSFVQREHFGNSLTFALAFFKLLRDKNNICYLGLIQDFDYIESSHFFAYYDVNGEMFIADPIESIANGVRSNDVYHISITDFKQKYSSPCYLYDPYGASRNLNFFSGFLNYPLASF